MEKPRLPEHPICDRSGHADTLNRCEAVLDMLSDLDSLDDDLANARTDRFWVNRMVSDSLRYVADSLQYKHTRNERRSSESTSLGEASERLGHSSTALTKKADYRKAMLVKPLK